MKSDYIDCCWVERYPPKPAPGRGPEHQYAIVCCDIYHGMGPAAYAYAATPMDAVMKANTESLSWKGMDDAGRMLILAAKLENDYSKKR